MLMECFQISNCFFMFVRDKKLLQSLKCIPLDIILNILPSSYVKNWKNTYIIIIILLLLLFYYFIFLFFFLISIYFYQIEK